MVLSLLLTLCLAEQPSASPAASTVTITGVLTKADGTPAKAQKVVAYPLDGEGEPIIVNSMAGGTVGLWNPKTETDATGRFVLKIATVSAIGPDKVAAVGLGLSEPPGGLVTGTVWGMRFSDAAKKEEMVFVRKGGIRLLRSASAIVKVELAAGPRADLGKITIP